MGNNASNPVRNMDKRTARRLHRGAFTQEIQNYRYEMMGEVGLEGDGDNDDDDAGRFREEAVDGGAAMPFGNSNIITCARKRPIFEPERKMGEFDVVTAVDGQNVTIHDARMHADMKNQIMNHHEFKYHRVFGEKDGNDEVYKHTVRPLIEYSIGGGFSTAMVYGQTGSGKTYTMTAMCERAAKDIFALLPAGWVVSCQFLEIVGDNTFDLLNSYAPVQLLTACDGCVHGHPMVEPTIKTWHELMSIIVCGQGIRATAATGVHDASSRSHSVLRIFMHPDYASSRAIESEPWQEGVLTLVDLAGSEHKIDSMYHNAERRKEGAAINSSLMALKQCIRAKAAGQLQNHYYRKSKLTMALKKSLSSPLAKTVVIATLSPASKDTEHSLNTLRHACVMDCQKAPEAANGEKETRFITGGDVKTVRLGEINMSQFVSKRGEEPAKELTSNGNEFRRNQDDAELTDKEKYRQRRAREKLALGKLKESNIDAHRKLGLARKTIGQDEVQYMRLRAAQPEEPDVEDETELVGESSLQPGEGKAAADTVAAAAAAEERAERKAAAAADNKARRLRNSLDQTVPMEMRLRQFRTLMKMNGLDPSQAQRVLGESEDGGGGGGETGGSSSGSGGCGGGGVGGGNDYDGGDGQPNFSSPQRQRPPHQEASPDYPDSSPEKEPNTVSHADMVRFRRQEIEEQRNAKNRARVASSTTARPGVASTVSSTKGQGPDRDIEEQIRKLQGSLDDAKLSEASKSGLKKRLATQKGILLRRRRQREKDSQAVQSVAAAEAAAAAAATALISGQQPFSSPSASQLPTSPRASRVADSPGMDVSHGASYDAPYGAPQQQQQQQQQQPEPAPRGLRRRSKLSYGTGNGNDASPAKSPPPVPEYHQQQCSPQPALHSPPLPARQDPRFRASPPMARAPPAQFAGFGMGMSTNKGAPKTRPQWDIGGDSLDTQMQSDRQPDMVFESPKAAYQQQYERGREPPQPDSELKKLETEQEEAHRRAQQEARARHGNHEAAMAREARVRAQHTNGAASAPWANDYTCDSELY